MDYFFFRANDKFYSEPLICEPDYEDLPESPLEWKKKGLQVKRKKQFFFLSILH